MWNIFLTVQIEFLLQFGGIFVWKWILTIKMIRKHFNHKWRYGTQLFRSFTVDFVFPGIFFMFPEGIRKMFVVRVRIWPPNLAMTYCLSQIMTFWNVHCKFRSFRQFILCFQGYFIDFRLPLTNLFSKSRDVKRFLRYYGYLEFSLYAPHFRQFSLYFQGVSCRFPSAATEFAI